MTRSETFQPHGVVAWIRGILDNGEPFDHEEFYKAVWSVFWEGDEREAADLLAHGLDPSIRNQETGWSLLHLATERGSASLVKALVQAGADVNAQDAQGWTPLHLAVDAEADGALQSNGSASLSLLALLVELGANPEIHDLRGRTPADIAERYGFHEAVNLLAMRQ